MRRLLPSRAVLAALTVGFVLALPASAGAYLDGGEGKWVPGSVLIKFDTQNVSEVEQFVHAIRAHVERRLPLIPGGYEIRVEGNLDEAIQRAFGLSHEQRPRGGTAVEWAQPNYYFDLHYFATPQDAAYYPNDPLFWPSAGSNPNNCSGRQAALGQAGLWPWYGDLANSLGAWEKANPLPDSMRLPDTSQYNVGLSGVATSSINVMPVWNALSESLPGGNRTTGPSGKIESSSVWLSSDLRRSGIAVLDSGLSSAPDLVKQVAGLISVGRQETEHPGQQYSFDRYTYDYFNTGVNLYDEIPAIKDELPGVKQHVPEPARPLLPIDDLGSQQVAPNEQIPLPTGCDGHGTEVASVAAATANNRMGIAGVGWNVPLLGIRPGVPVLDGALDSEQTTNLGGILQQARAARSVRLSDSSMIDALGIVKALRVPVLNMSWGSQLFATGIKHHEEDVIVTRPAVVEALGRLLTDGETLGVAAAGQGKYGFGSKHFLGSIALGDRFAAQIPCALKSLGTYKPRVLAGRGADPRFWIPGFSWARANLLCVTGTYTDSQQLIEGDQGVGAGTSAVDLAAPGVTTVVNRPTRTALMPAETYRLATGSSFAAAMVSGAAALLREVAPDAPPRVIAQALQAGARPSVQLARFVRYGQLDVACSALWLAQRGPEHPNWKVRVAADKLAGPYTSKCFRPDVQYGTTTWELPKSNFDPDSKTNDDGGLSIPAVPRREPGNVLPERAIGRAAVVKALGFQALVLGQESTWNKPETAFFPIKAGNLFAQPQPAPSRPLYNFQSQTAACPPASRITGIGIKWKDAIHPQGYAWISPKATLGSATLMLALVKPWYVGLLPTKMLLSVEVKCVADIRYQEP
jgi:hypothetical protein